MNRNSDLRPPKVPGEIEFIVLDLMIGDNDCVRATLERVYTREDTPEKPFRNLDIDLPGQQWRIGDIVGMKIVNKSQRREQSDAQG